MITGAPKFNQTANPTQANPHLVKTTMPALKKAPPTSPPAASERLPIAQLKSLGAEGIVEYPLNKVVY